MGGKRRTKRKNEQKRNQRRVFAAVHAELRASVSTLLSACVPIRIYIQLLSLAVVVMHLVPRVADVNPNRCSHVAGRRALDPRGRGS